MNNSLLQEYPQSSQSHAASPLTLWVSVVSASALSLTLNLVFVSGLLHAKDSYAIWRFYILSECCELDNSLGGRGLMGGNLLWSSLSLFAWMPHATYTFCLVFLFSQYGSLTPCIPPNGIMVHLQNLSPSPQDLYNWLVCSRRLWH